MAATDYNEVRAQVLGSVVDFLHAFENVQQSILFQQVDIAQRELKAATGDRLQRAAAALDEHQPPSQHTAAHDVLRQALEHLGNAYTGFVRHGAWPEFAQSFLASRGQQCQALTLLYQHRAAFLPIDQFFQLDDPANVDPRVTQTTAPPDALPGLSHHAAGADHHEYSLYVPEYYSAATAWPVIVALHGGYGRGNEYIWSWLRAARSRGYIVISPKSYGQTWSIMQPPLDRDSILTILGAVAARLNVDGSRTFLTGLSDGATFSFLLGLESHERFAAMAPIAGVLSPMLDPLLRAGTGKHLPIHIVHGVHDAIFPVQTVRSTNELLRRLGYNFEYTELPDWGHALTTSINETLVLPWFEAQAAA